MYTHAINDAGQIDPELIKRSFDDYINIIEQRFLQKLDYAYCDKSDSMPVCFRGDRRAQRHLDHLDSQINELGDEFYILFKILDMTWKNQEILLRDVEYLTPCRIFLLYSVIKRKYNAELDIE